MASYTVKYRQFTWTDESIHTVARAQPWKRFRLAYPILAWEKNNNSLISVEFAPATSYFLSEVSLAHHSLQKDSCSVLVERISRSYYFSHGPQFVCALLILQGHTAARRHAKIAPLGGTNKTDNHPFPEHLIVFYHFKSVQTRRLICTKPL